MIPATTREPLVLRAAEAATPISPSTARATSDERTATPIPVLRLFAVSDDADVREAVPEGWVVAAMAVRLEVLESAAAAERPGVPVLTSTADEVSAAEANMVTVASAVRAVEEDSAAAPIALVVAVSTTPLDRAAEPKTPLKPLAVSAADVDRFADAKVVTYAPLIPLGNRLSPG